MNKEKKHDDAPEKEPKKLSKEELKDAAGGGKSDKQLKQDADIRPETFRKA